MKLLCFFVNYRADEPLRRCLASLAVARLGASCEVTVHVLDNSEYDELGRQRLLKLATCDASLPVQVHFPEANGGYFAGVPLAQKLAREWGANALIYSNPDVAFAPDFLIRLYEQLNKENDLGVLAPAIVTESEGFDQNPKYKERLQLAKLRRLRMIYASKLAFKSYMGLARIKEKIFGRRARPTEEVGGRIYAPHGAVFVFVDIDFFLSLPPFPCFLFGEELFVGEEARQRKVPIGYAPSLKIIDMRSQSVSRLPGEFHRALMLRSVEYILETYYRQESP